MYQQHFGFSAEPFSIAPDPRFLYLSEVHNEALAHLLYGFSHGGFVLITGEVGTGKTTLLRNLLDRTPPDLDVAFILNPRLTVRELLESLCDELGVNYPRGESLSVKQYIDVLNKHLLATHQAGRSTVVIIDEAQNLSPAVLEQIRLLTNLETNDKKLLRIILLGQPELADMLARTELRQLAQRITARYHLKELNKGEVAAYVSHRLNRAGGNPGIFTARAVKALYRCSRGTPRLINVIADRALLGAYVAGKFQVDAGMVRNAAREVFGSTRRKMAPYYAAAAIVLIGLVAAMGWFYMARQDQRVASIVHEPAPAQTQAPAQLPAAPTEPERAIAELPEALAGEPLTPTLPMPQADSTQPAVAPAAEREPLPPADLSRPAGQTFVTHRQAYRAVFAAWGADYPVESASIPCDFAPSAGLQCLSRNGGWTEINALNAPVVLELWDDQPAPYYAALVGREAGAYRLQIGERQTLATPRDLRDHWFGSYVVLWQTPPDYFGSLRQGDRHATVRWLRNSLAQLQPDQSIGTTDELFDRALHDAVTEFQQNEGLVADGIVGPMTWIRISDRLNLPAPRLQD